MASLWAVDDEATQQLMVDFYQNLKQGMTKGQALQKAKLKLIADLLITNRFTHNNLSGVIGKSRIRLPVA